MRLSPLVSIKAPSGLTMNSLPWTMSVSIRRAREVITAWVKSIQDVLAAVLLDHEHFLGCGHAWQVDGELGQLAERPS